MVYFNEKGDWVELGHIPTISEIERGAEALRNYQQKGRLLRKWSDLPNGAKKKWLQKSEIVLRAALSIK
jgi:hypothetical protein